MAAKIAKTFRLIRSDAEILERLSNEYEVSQTEIIARAIRLLDEQGESSTPTNDAQYELLARQLETKDDQISALMRAIEHTQMLHAQDMQRILPVPGKPKGGKAAKGKHKKNRARGR